MTELLRDDGMLTGEVVVVLDVLAAVIPRVWVAGGWGVDALVGRRTRSHRDLDLAVDVTGADLDDALRALAARGYELETDWRPSRVELTAAGSRRVDLHPVVFDESGVGRQANVASMPPFAYLPGAFVYGLIAGRQVRCLSVAQQQRFHAGYPPRACDRHDLALLEGLAGTSATTVHRRSLKPSWEAEKPRRS